MQQLYGVLGVPSGAGDDEIKAAFRHLAKQLHPDLNPADEDAERRLRDVIKAYETLSDPQSRIAYDAGLARQRSLRRWRFRAKATTMLTVFALTVSIGLSWRQLSEVFLQAGEIPAPLSATDKDAKVVTEVTSAPAAPDPSSADELVAGSRSLPGSTEPPSSPPAPLIRTDVASSRQDHDPDPPMPSKRSDAPVVGEKASEADQQPSQPVAPVSLASPAPSEAVENWASYRDTSFGFALEYPGNVFQPDPEPPREGKSFLSRDGRAHLLISAASNTSGMTLARHRRSLMEGPYKGATFDYTPQRSTWFVLSGTLGTNMFYERVTSSCDGRALHGWKLVYPLSERTFYDRIVEEVHRRYRHGNGPGGRCAEASR